MNANQEYVERITSILKANQVSIDRPTRIAYRVTHGLEALFHENLDDLTPDIVIRPESTEEVITIIKLSNEFEIPIVPQGGRTGSCGAEGMRGGIVLDLANMNKILDIDEKAYRITAQAGIRIKDYNEYLQQKGYMPVEYPSMSWTSTLGARAGVSGYNKFENTWGGSAVNIKGIEVVLANGDVVQLGRGSRIPAKNVTGFDLMSLFLGSRGTFGVITALTEQFIDIPPKEIYGIWAFKCTENALEAYTELLGSNYRGAMWRSKAYPKLRIRKMMEVMEGKNWPEDIEMVVDYNIYGPRRIAEAMEEICKEIMEKHHGFWRDDIPSTGEVAQKSHEERGKVMGMGSLSSDRLITGGMGFKILPLDPMIPHSRLLEAYNPLVEHLRKIENGKSYPALTGKLFIFDPGSAIPGELGYTKLWINLLVDSKRWDNETRKEYKEWFREYAELVWSYDAALTGTHGAIPSEMQAEITKKEIGEKEYELLKTIKHALDPKNIMNPKIIY